MNHRQLTLFARRKCLFALLVSLLWNTEGSARRCVSARAVLNYSPAVFDLVSLHITYVVSEIFALKVVKHFFFF